MDRGNDSDNEDVDDEEWMFVCSCRWCAQRRYTR